QLILNSRGLFLSRLFYRSGSQFSPDIVSSRAFFSSLLASASHPVLVLVYQSVSRGVKPKLHLLSRTWRQSAARNHNVVLWFPDRGFYLARGFCTQWLHANPPHNFSGTCL